MSQNVFDSLFDDDSLEEEKVPEQTQETTETTTEETSDPVVEEVTEKEPVVEEVQADETSKDNRTPREIALINDLRMERLEAKQAREEALRHAREAEQYRLQFQQWETQQKRLQEQFQAPTLQEDPEAYFHQREAQLQQQMIQHQIQVEYSTLESQLGAEKMKAAWDWGSQRLTTDPVFGQIIDSQPNPVRFLVQEYDKHQKLENLNDPTKFAELVRQEAMKMGYVPPATTTTPVVQTAAPIVKTAPKDLPGANLAGEGGVGSTQAVEEPDFLDELINRRRK